MTIEWGKWRTLGAGVAGTSSKTRRQRQLPNNSKTIAYNCPVAVVGHDGDGTELQGLASTIHPRNNPVKPLTVAVP